MSQLVETTPAIGFDSAGLRMTPAEFDAVDEYDELYRYELVDGVLVVTPFAHESEADPNELLSYLLHRHQAEHANGCELDATLPGRFVHVENGRRRADRVVWCGLGRRPNPKFDPPSIAIEFVSRGKRNRVRDYETKRDEYAKAGVGEYWIVDRFRRTMTVHRFHEGKSETRVVGENETYATDLLPGFELPLAELLARADRWDA